MPEIDRRLLSGIERGERAALEELARQYAPPVYRFLVRMCGDATLAEDLAQDVAVQLWRALPGRRFPNARALNAWVYRVATNAFYMHRRRKRASEVQWEEELDLPAGEEQDPAHLAEQQELSWQVRRAVELLPEPERQALLLKAFSDLKYGEIAQATGEPVGTVKWRISRAYAKLRQLLRPELRPTEEDDELVQPAARVPRRRDEPDGSLARGGAPAPLPGLSGAKSG